MGTLTIQDLGLIGYQEAWSVQRRCVDAVMNDREQNFLLLCEHPCVLTLGRMADRTHILFADRCLADRRISVYSVDRGGEVTLHAPGQLVVYPILNLDRFGRDLHRYLEQLEHVGIDFLRFFDIVGERVHGKTGVWVKGKKIISIGIGVRKWISFHGLGINIQTDLSLFKMIRPCGLDVEMTSVAEQNTIAPDMDRAKAQLTAVFKERFDF